MLRQNCWIRFLSIVSFLLLWATVNLIAPSPAGARVYDLYRADYPKGAFCSAIGGACASDADLENGFFQNPAALMSHLEDWNFDGDYSGSGNLEPGMKGGNQVTESQFMAGAGWSDSKLGLGLGLSGRRNSVISSLTLANDSRLLQNLPLSTTATTLQLNLPVSYRVNRKLVLGLSLNCDFYFQSLLIEGAGSATSGGNGIPSFGITLGALYTESKYLRLGSWFRTPITNYNSVSFSTQIFSNQLSYEEDMAIRFPWIWAIGASWMPWADQRIFLFDLDIIGNTPNGYQLTYDTFESALGDRKIRTKGRNIVVEPRLGFRYPWGKQKLGTALLGSYYETSRWSALSGRYHFTGGLAYKAFSWLEVMGGLDVAREFTQISITFR